MNQKKKLLYIVEAFGGGVFSYLADLTGYLAENYQIVIAYGLRDQTPKNFQSYFRPEIKFIKVENFSRSVNPAKDLRALQEIRHICEQFRPDIIHLHSSKAGVLGRVAFSSRKVPVFYTPHGYSFLMQNESQWKRMIYKGIERIMTSFPCTTISCSKGEHEATLELTKNALYVNNGVHREQLDNILSSLAPVQNSGTHAVFTLGRICYQKNPELFNQIALQFPDIPFIWIGDGELKSLLTAKNIEVTGWLNREDALRKTQNADIFMLTSLWEGLPISLLEAMYMKKICIVSDVIGNRDVIHTGENGFVCKTIQDFVQAVRSAQNPESRKLTEHAYQDILKEYNTETMASSYDKIYQKAIQKKVNL